MYKGTVKWYNAAKGFGFIINEEDKDVFVHRTSLKENQSLEPEQKVQFDIGEGKKGPMAINVEVVED